MNILPAGVTCGTSQLVHYLNGLSYFAHKQTVGSVMPLAANLVMTLFWFQEIGLFGCTVLLLAQESRWLGQPIE